MSEDELNFHVREKIGYSSIDIIENKIHKYLRALNKRPETQLVVYILLDESIRMHEFFGLGTFLINIEKRFIKKGISRNIIRWSVSRLTELNIIIETREELNNKKKIHLKANVENPLFKEFFYIIQNRVKEQMLVEKEPCEKSSEDVNVATKN